MTQPQLLLLLQQQARHYQLLLVPTALALQMPAAQMRHQLRHYHHPRPTSCGPTVCQARLDGPACGATRDTMAAASTPQ